VSSCSHPARSHPSFTPSCSQVRCDVVELKLTLLEKHTHKSLQDGVLLPFLAAYAKKSGRQCSAADVRRVEVDGTC
jgi:hypothetical protein